MSEGWGVGKERDVKAYDKVMVGNREVELIHGEYPHSRQDNSTYARWPNGEIEGFDGHRWPLKIEIEETNYLKESHLSGNQVRKSCRCHVYIKGKMVYTFRHRTAEKVLQKLVFGIYKILEHPMMHYIVDGKGEFIGRRIKSRYEGHEGKIFIINRYLPEQGAFIATDEFVPKDSKDFDEGLKDDLLSELIDWYPDSKLGEG